MGTFFTHLHCGVKRYFLKEVSHASLSDTLCRHICLIHTVEMKDIFLKKPIMLLFHVHCGSKRFSFKETSHFSLLSTRWVHLSLAYTMGTKHIPWNNPVIFFLSSTLWEHFSSTLFAFLSITLWGLSRYFLQVYPFSFLIYSDRTFLSHLHSGDKRCFMTILWCFSLTHTVGAFLSPLHCGD